MMFSKDMANAWQVRHNNDFKQKCLYEVADTSNVQ